MIDAVSPNIVFKVVFQAMADTGEILGLRSVTEGHQLEQDIERQWGRWKRRPTFNGMPNSLSPRSRSTTTRIKLGSTRDIVENLWQEQFGCLERLPGASVAQFGIRQQVRRDGKVVVGLTGYRQRARWLDDQ